MADQKKPKQEKFTTPKGVAVYPRLTEPDTKFNAAGVFSVKLRLSEEDAQPFIDRIEALAKEKFEAEKAELMKGDGKAKAKAKSLKYADKPYKAAVDDNGDETGEIEINFKMNHKVTIKGKETLLYPKIFDAAGKELKPAPAIWGGSVIKVAGQFNPFSTTVGVGVSLRLSAVQVLELVSSGGGNAESFGFGAEEGGFVAEANTSTSDSDASADADTEAPEEF